MNKKGFTLVELLAAITILALLALVTVPAITRPVKESKQELYESQLRSFKDSAKSWGAEKMFSNLPNKGSCILLPLSILVNDGLVEPNVISPLDGEKFVKENASSDTGVFIKINNEGSNHNKYVYTVYDCNSSTCFNPDNKEDDSTYYSLSSECSLYRE